MTGFRAVTFDAGGTLVRPWPSVGAVYAETLLRAGFGAMSAAELEDRFRAAWMARSDFDYSRAAWARLVQRVLESLVDPMRQEEAFERLWNRFQEPEAWQVFPDVPQCLADLHRRGLRMAVVSNWDERLHAVLRGLGLAEAFEFVLPSVEGPAPKPDARLFQAAAARLGLPPEAILHVGDSRREDVDGARAAGFQACWLQRDERGGAPPDTVRSLAAIGRIAGGGFRAGSADGTRSPVPAG